MSTEAITKFEPHRTIYMRGFDRRGCAAALSSASAGGFTCSGVFADLADFVVLVLFDADDSYGHLTTTRYLPDFNLTGVVVDFDVACTNGMYMGSSKFPSVPWGSLSWIEENGTTGTTALDISSTAGEAAATAVITFAGTPTTGDLVQIVYLGNTVFAPTITTGQPLATVAANFASAINAANSANPVASPLTAASVGAALTITCTQPGSDGNTIELLSMEHGNTTISPSGVLKMTGGVDPTGFHVHLDFSAMTLTSLRQCWLTLAPSLPIDSAADGNPTLVPFTAKEFEYVFSNWTVTDPDSNTPLKVAGPGSVVVGSQDGWAEYAGSGWGAPVAGAFYRGFGKESSHATDVVTIFYSCQGSHNLYVSGLGTFHVDLDGLGEPDVSFPGPNAARRLVAASVAAGTHTLMLTVAAGASCTFDFLHAAVLSDVQAAAQTYPNVNAACDFDTGQTYQIPPERALWVLEKLGYAGDLDFYAGVFFALNRVRNGGNFHQAMVSLGGTLTAGDSIFVVIGGTTVGVEVYALDTLTTLAQRFVNGINGLFVGVCAAPTSIAGQFTITTLSPINGFTLPAPTLSAGATETVSMTGDINAGNEGTWAVEQLGSPVIAPLNRAFVDYLTDFATLIQAAGQTMTVAFSQELLAPPDENTSAGAWSQRFADGTTVLTDTGFGSWGAGFVEEVASGVYQQTGHGYIIGNSAHFANSTQSGEWYLVVTDANHYTLGEEIANSGGYTPGVGDSVFIDLQTSQCAFNPETVTPYLAACYVQAAGILATAGLIPWLQFGEILHWFYSETMSLAVAAFSNSGGLIEVETVSAHGFTTGTSTAILAGTGLIDGTQTVTYVDGTHFTVNWSTWPGGSPAAAGTVSGGGMAFYDANQTAAAETALGRALANFYTQDDDPSVNSGADADYLAGRIYFHISAIVAAVLAVESGAQFELLYPLDVNFPSCYYTAAIPNPQGGRLDAAVNLPSQFTAMSGSGLNRLKVEGLSWQSAYFNHDNFLDTMRFPYGTLSWAATDVALLIAWDSGSCPWTRAYLAWLNEHNGPPLANLWAVDHMQLFSWPAVLPVNAPGVAM